LVAALLVNRIKSIRPLWTIFTIAVILVVPLGCLYFFSTQPISNDDAIVPNIIGLSSGEAESVLDNAQLAAEQISSAYAQNAQPGEVLSQWPEAGVKVKLGRLVTYTVAVGQLPVTVPDLVGRPYSQAEQLILSKGLTVGRLELPDGKNPSPEDVQNAKVISQSPSPETVVKSGVSVDLGIIALPAADDTN